VILGMGETEMDLPVSTAERLQRIKVIGVGGGGSNAVKRMIESGIVGVDFIAVNTSLKEIKGTRAPVRLQIGESITHGLSTGGDVALGAQAAEAAAKQIEALLKNTDMVFIAATLGGGTGTGAAPVIARIAKSMGVLTVAVVTKPFGFEGARKARIAETGLQALVKTVDAEIVISNDRLLTLEKQDLKLTDAFVLADEMLQQAVQTVCDFVLKVGVINVDLRDVTAILTGGGRTMVNVTRAKGDDRALIAAQEATSSPLLDITLEGATGLLLNIEGGNLSLGEVHSAAELITRMASPDANIIFGYIDNKELGDQIVITVIATGYRLDANGRPQGAAPITRDSPIEVDLDHRPFDPRNLDVPTRLRR
jgi:cell division protein FtsZ